MIEVRGYATGINLGDDCIWITGGQDRPSYSVDSTEYLFTNGTSIDGPRLPYKLYEHCTVKLPNGTVFFIGGHRSENKTKTFTMDPESGSTIMGPELLHNRRRAGCAIWYSPAHEGRPVVIAIGDYNNG